MEKQLLEDFLQNKIKDKIIGQEKKLLFSVMVLFCEVNGKLNLLFEKRAMNIAQGGEISFPGGKKEKGDVDFTETALRETEEEIGISRDRIEKVINYGKLVMATGQLIEVKLGYIENFNLNEIQLNKDEVERVFLVPLEFLLKTEPHIEKVMVQNNPHYENGNKKIIFPSEKLGLPQIYWKPWGREREIYFYKYKDDIIWGITGEIIYSLINDIKNSK
ncbi:MAG: CoA pyrophosphatase [Fusobacterium perfoetens]|uniref:NUDIX hydrolase n=1 Tax=Fusobacterium perfoetens TaxID=852 RepID=UPI0023F55FE6|nr:CoA pyrophosphatase [Fusobacterium perfoetens]MCI6151871.1 CoA pyrophosphatase [Fusobacterium perfoetens]MDY3236768.1 CoA pyrophosphatase [Fusobacterium perfoetens]